MSERNWKLLGLALLGSILSPLVLADEPAAKPENLQALFKQLDVNGDGVISKDEVPADKRTLAERLFRNADKNGDGKLSTLEFESGLAKQAESAPERAPGTGPLSARPGMAGQGAEQLWKMLDRNGTGSVKPSDVPEERRERFTKMLELADSNKDGALSKEEFQKIAARMAPREGTPGRERPEDAKSEAAKPESAARDGERKPEGRLDGERPGMGREGDRPSARPEGRPEFAPGGPRGPRGAGIFFILDTDRDGRLSKSELENAGKVLSKLDRNGDGEVTPQELMPEGRPEMRRPEGDRPQGSDRPASDRPAVREGDRPREGERRPEARGDGERRPAGPRDGDKTREGERPRDADKPKSE